MKVVLTKKRINLLIVGVALTNNLWIYVLIINRNNKLRDFKQILINNKKVCLKESIVITCLRLYLPRPFFF